MSYDQPKPHWLIMLNEKRHPFSLEEVKQMDDGGNAKLALQYGSIQQRAKYLLVGRKSREATMTLTHKACHDRNCTGTGLGHILCNERPQQPYVNHNPS